MNPKFYIPRRFLVVLLLGLSSPLAAQVSQPFAQGAIDELKWEVRFNMPRCEYEGHPRNSWCKFEDNEQAATVTGIEDRLTQLIKNQKIKTVMLATFSLTNRAIVEALCDEANSRDFKAKLFVQSTQLQYSKPIKKLNKCSSNIQVFGRGKRFDSQDSYIQHAKIFLASESPDATPLSFLREQLSPEELDARNKDRVVFTSNSGNLSTVGAGLHMENWLVFDTISENNLAQQNLCFFYAMEHMDAAEIDSDERRLFAEKYATCKASIQPPSVEGITFLPVPDKDSRSKAFKTLQSMLQSAKQSIKLASHRLTTKSVFYMLKNSQDRGVIVDVILEDDVIRTGKCDGGYALEVNPNSVYIYRELAKEGTNVRFMETNGKVPHMFHNKFVIVDDQEIFQGAGNFTAAALNAYGQGNFEQFYHISHPDIVKAYVDAWEYFTAIATVDKSHPVYDHKDKKVVPVSSNGGLMKLDDSPCMRNRTF
jgi:hypothetical protein